VTFLRLPPFPLFVFVRRSEFRGGQSGRERRGYWTGFRGSGPGMAVMSRRRGNTSRTSLTEFAVEDAFCSRGVLASSS
jgi:hypothetical protein